MDRDSGEHGDADLSLSVVPGERCSEDFTHTKEP
jgi:hypothetical protein